MREENVVSVAELLGRQGGSVRLVAELTESNTSRWTDWRTGFTDPVSHQGIRLLEIEEGYVDLKYGAVFLPTGELIAESTVWDPFRFLMNNPRPPISGDTRFQEGFTVFPSSSFYHFLTEDLPRVAWILEAFPGRQIVGGSNCPQYAAEAAVLLTGSMKRTSATYMRVRNYPFITFGSASGWPEPSTVEFVRRLGLAWQQEVAEMSTTKIYVSRMGSSRSPVNEHQLAILASERGYERIEAKDLSLKEQIRIFAGATSILGVHGAGLANSIWMPGGSRVIELMDPGYYNPCYQWLSSVRGISHQTLLLEGVSTKRVEFQALETVL